MAMQVGPVKDGCRDITLEKRPGEFVRLNVPQDKADEFIRKREDAGAKKRVSELLLPIGGGIIGGVAGLFTKAESKFIIGETAKARGGWCGVMGVLAGCLTAFLLPSFSRPRKLEQQFIEENTKSII